MRPTPMEEVKRTNTIVVRNSLQEQAGRERIRRDINAIEVDREKNCYSCREFGHIMQNCRNQEIVD